MLDADGKMYLQRVRGAAQRMEQLIDDMLKLANVTSSALTWQTVNLSALARSIVRDLHQTQPERKVTFRIAADIMAHGDQRLLRVVLANLLENAWKYTGRQERAELEFGSMVQDGETVYFVRDNGAGFDMTYSGKLFSAFQRLHGAEEFDGNGIGLATVQRVIRRHGGKVWGEGDVGKGAVFYFTLGQNQSDEIGE
jgi:light-regulated signal transduction histidine kinase (bacteriophytochrome)